MKRAAKTAAKVVFGGFVGLAAFFAWMQEVYWLQWLIIGSAGLYAAGAALTAIEDWRFEQDRRHAELVERLEDIERIARANLKRTIEN